MMLKWIVAFRVRTLIYALSHFSLKSQKKGLQILLNPVCYSP